MDSHLPLTFLQTDRGPAPPHVLGASGKALAHKYCPKHVKGKHRTLKHRKFLGSFKSYRKAIKLTWVETLSITRGCQ